MKLNKRKAEYIAITVILCIMSLIIGTDAAFIERGYFAFGGEWLMPFYIAGAAYVTYKQRARKKEQEDET